MIVRVLVVALAAAAAAAATAQAPTAPAAPAAQAAQAAAAPAPIPRPDKNTLSYTLGFDVGKGIGDAQVEVDFNQVLRGMQDAFNRRNPAFSEEQMTAALGWMQQQAMAQARAEFERMSRENKQRSDAFLAANRAKPGVTVLPSGIQYRVIDAGSGARPTANSEVQLHFRLSLPTGQELGNTYATNNAQPPTFRVDQFPVQGVREVLPLMPAGARWEVFLPPEKNVNPEGRSIGGPGQALVFDLRLVSVQ